MAKLNVAQKTGTVSDRSKKYFEKMIITTIFSFSHNDFKSLISQGYENSGLCGNVLVKFYPFPANASNIIFIEKILSGFESIYINPLKKQGLEFMCLQNKSLENTMGKGETDCYEQFLLFPQCFLPIWRTFCQCH